MNKERIEQWVRGDQLRKKSLDKEKVKSIIESSMTNMGIVKSIPLSEQSAILIFRETYESIRQLGDAQWWLRGYEPRNHEVSMEILKEMDIKEKNRLNHLSRFKSIRNDANYRGFKVTMAQAKEILEFWNTCSQEIIASLLKELQ
ncbi:hypothetical protein HYX13_02760 [Candidatus Woesearchaeota archaeon]|nr:hypothetical protein [Candidatus Woesearchaeota archaeon]